MKKPKRNIEILDCENNCEIVDSDVSNLEEFDKISNYQFDLVFLDPPYKDMNLNFILEKIKKILIFEKPLTFKINKSLLFLILFM